MADPEDVFADLDDLDDDSAVTHAAGGLAGPDRDSVALAHAKASILERNMSCLFTTARLEIRRKNDEIAHLRAVLEAARLVIDEQQRQIQDLRVPAAAASTAPRPPGAAWESRPASTNVARHPGLPSASAASDRPRSHDDDSRPRDDDRSRDWRGGPPAPRMVIRDTMAPRHAWPSR